MNNKDEESNLYSAGIATADITPPVGISLCGFGHRKLHTSTAVYHPLRTVAVVINDGNTPILFISAEWVFFEELAERVRTRLSMVTGIPADQIILSGTHTHCGPCLRKRDIDNHGAGMDFDYIHQSIETMAKTARIAWENQFPARLKFGKGHCELAVSRRSPDPDNPGKVLRQLTPNYEGVTDHEVSILTIESEDEVVRGILFQYSCHLTSRSGLMIGGDYAGFAYDYLQEAFNNAQPCFLQGCGADQKPRPPVDAEPGTFGNRSVDQVQDIGFELGESIEKAIKKGEFSPVSGPITASQKIIELETEPLDEELVAEELNISGNSYRKKWAKYHQERIDKNLPQERHVPFEIQTVRFGDSLAVVTLAAEATVGHALRLKRELSSDFKNVLPLAYANDVIGYVPVRKQFSEFGYEVLDANQARMRTGRYVKETEEQIHSTIHEMLGVN